MLIFMLSLVRQVEESSEAPSPTTPDRHPHADAPEAPAALSEAAAEALERYKRSAAAAATAAEPHTASGTGYTEMQAGLANNQLPLPKVSFWPCTFCAVLFSGILMAQALWRCQCSAAAAAAQHVAAGKRRYSMS